MEQWINNGESDSNNNLYRNRYISFRMYRNSNRNSDGEFKCHHYCERFSDGYLQWSEYNTYCCGRSDLFMEWRINT